MPHDPSSEQPLPQVDDPVPNIAAFIMARAFAEIYKGANHGPLPKALAAILRQIKGRGGRA